MNTEVGEQGGVSARTSRQSLGVFVCQLACCVHEIEHVTSHFSAASAAKRDGAAGHGEIR